MHMLRRLVAVGLPAALACVVVIATAQAATTSIRFPISFTATDCPDPVALSGTLHEVFTTVVSANGNVLVNVVDNPQGVTGIGLVSGRVYQGTGVTRESITIAKGSTDTFVNNFRLISRGPGSDVIVQNVFHITVNANGDVTATLDKSTVTCT
jgi:hypothetical protein